LWWKEWHWYKFFTK